MNSHQSHNNVIPFVCPSWQPQELIRLVTEGCSADEEEKFFEHCAKCHFCRRSATQILENENKSLTHVVYLTKRKLLALVAAILFVTTLTGHFYLRPATTISSSEIALASQTTSKNLYEQLDGAIDQYLTTSDTAHLDLAKQIAQRIYAKNDDNWGLDLVSFYQQVSHDNLIKFIYCRNKLNKLNNATYSNNAERFLVEAQELERDFLLLGNPIESYRARILQAKVQSLTSNESYKLTVKDGLAYSEKNSYKFLRSYFLLWQAKSKEASEGKLQETISFSESLGIEEVKSSAKYTLAGLYHNKGESVKALSICQEILKHPPKAITLVGVLQIAGISACALNQADLARQYLDQALVLSEETGQFFNVGLCTTLLANTYSHQKEFGQAELLFNKATATVKNIQDPLMKGQLMSTITVYLAKDRLAQGKHDQASTLYQEAILFFESADRKNSLELSQLYLGLSLALEKSNPKEALRYKELSNYCSSNAKLTKEIVTISCILSYIPANCINNKVSGY